MFYWEKIINKGKYCVSKITVTVFLIMPSVIFIPDVQAKRDKDVAIVKYDKYEYGAKRQWCIRSLVKVVKKANDNTPDLVNADIFLPFNSEKRDTYKRILIPAIAFWFSPEMYNGMTEYVKNGGLLITNSIMNGIDEDADYNRKGAKSFGKPGNPLVGVFGISTVQMNKIMIKENSPLSEGLSSGDWIELETKTSGSQTQNRSATVLIISDSLYKNKPSRQQPFLTYKHLGKGACIYIVPAISVKNRFVFSILKNALSKNTLEWLTAGEAVETH